MSSPAIRLVYEMWPQYNRRLRDVIAALDYSVTASTFQQAHATSPIGKTPQSPHTYPRRQDAGISTRPCGVANAVQSWASVRPASGCT